MLLAQAESRVSYGPAPVRSTTAESKVTWVIAAAQEVSNASAFLALCGDRRR